MIIHTTRLELIPATAEMLRAELHGPRELQALLGVQVPESWPPELYDADAIAHTLTCLTEHAEPSAWWLYYFVRKATPAQPAVAIGAGGYRGPPQEGTVEIGYSVLPEHRRQDYASEATAALAAHAFAQPDIVRVIAHTLPELVPSIGVLEKCGFRYIGEGAEEVLRQVLRDAVRIAGLGIGLGVAAAIPATYLLREQLFGVSPTDPATLAAVVAVLAASAVAAAYLPACRATRVDPVIALRHE